MLVLSLIHRFFALIIVGISSPSLHCVRGSEQAFDVRYVGTISDIQMAKLLKAPVLLPMAKPLPMARPLPTDALAQGQGRQEKDVALLTSRLQAPGILTRRRQHRRHHPGA